MNFTAKPMVNPGDFPFNQSSQSCVAMKNPIKKWDFQDHKTKALYHIYKARFCGDVPWKLTLTWALLHMVGTSNLVSWNGQWMNSQLNQWKGSMNWIFPSISPIMPIKSPYLGQKQGLHRDWIHGWGGITHKTWQCFLKWNIVIYAKKHELMVDEHNIIQQPSLS